MNLTLQLAPGYTVTLQPYTLAGVAVGSPISPSSVAGSLYTFNLTGLAAGDYNVQLAGNWESNGQRFPMRKTALGIYIADYWWQINAAIAGGVVITPPISESVCRVQITVRRGVNAIQARILITCGSTGRLSDTAFADIAFNGETAANGFIQVDLPWSSITGIGKYRFRFLDYDTGDCFHDRTVTVPNIATALYEALT